MADRETLTVVLPPDLAADLHGAVASGDYADVNEIVRDALQNWRLRRLVRDGIESGPGLDADEAFARLRARFGQPAAE